MSSGGKVQLAFVGVQDTYLTGRPETTFFRAVYKRYTNFSKECIWVPFDGNPRKGGKSTGILERQGDLVQEMFITADVSVADADLNDGTKSNHLAYAAERLIDSVELYIGQQLIDKHYQRWWRIYSELTHDEARKAQYSKMTSPDSAGTCSIYLPLMFFFNRNPGLAMPMVALANQQVKIVCNWNKDEAIWTASDSTPTVLEPTIKLWADYIFLDQDERNVIKNRDQSYLIDQLQFGGIENIESASRIQRIPLSFKHPVKEIVWCFPNTAQSQQQYNYTTKPTNVTEKITAGQTEPHMSGGVVRLTDTATISETSDGPLDTMRIEINKHKVTLDRDGNYYNKIQPNQHHTGCPMPGLYSYSFALQPESCKPSGSCNFSRIQEAACYVKAKDLVNPKLEMYATNFNVLDIKQGFASLAFSN